MRLRLLQKVLRFKYLKTYLFQGNKLMALYSVVYDRKKYLNDVDKNAITFQVPRRFFNILISTSSKLKWKWLNILKGVIYVSIFIEPYFSKKSFKNLVIYSKKYFVIFGFIRNIFFSRLSLQQFENSLPLGIDQLSFSLLKDNFFNNFLISIIKSQLLFFLFFYRIMYLLVKRLTL